MMKPFTEMEDVILTEEELLNFSESQYGSAKAVRPSRQVILEWRNIYVTPTTHRGWFCRRSIPTTNQRILRNVSGVAIPGSLLAVMGSSGCGKTTLMNTLTMRCQSHLMIEGSILVNGRPVAPGQMDAICAYVQQDYLMPGFLTVKEQLTFQALLRMDSSLSYNQKLIRVDKIMRELGLTKCQDVLIGIPGRMQGISGGERRRLAFASEVLTDPPIIICDEPTSGLDAAMAQNVVSILHKMAEKGKTVICTIHQPSSYQYALFDRIMLLAKGELAFLGTGVDALSFFSRLNYPCPLDYNPADHFIHLLAGLPSSPEEEQTNFAAMICQAYATSEEAKTMFEKLPSGMGEDSGAQIPLDKFDGGQDLKIVKYKASIATQLRVVMWRSWVSVVRNSMQIKARTVESLFLGIFFSLIYRDQHLDQVGVFNISGMFSSLVCMVSLQCIFAVILSDSNDILLFLRDDCTGMYRTGVYVICKFIAEIPTYVFFPLLMCFFPFYLSGLNEGMELIIICVVFVLVAASTVSFGYIMTCIGNTAGEAMALVPFFWGPLLVTSGFFVRIGSIPVYIQWMKHISWLKYANEALSINEWKDVEHIGCNVDNSTCPRNGLAILEVMDFDPNNLPVDITALTMLAMGYQALGWTALSIRTWGK